MSANVSSILYLVAGVLFIMALRGLSHPTTSRQGNLYGMAGMGLAILTTLVGAPPAGIGAWALVILGLAAGGGAGAYIARQVPMTAMPQLVAAFHSLVGLAAVLVAAAALYAPQAFGIGQPGHIPEGSLFEMALGVAIGAITFTGSIIAFLKLDGRMSGKPIMLPSRHLINIALGVLLVVLLVVFVRGESRVVFWLVVLVSFALGVLLIVPIGGADMPVVISTLNAFTGLSAAAAGVALDNTALIVAGMLVGASGSILTKQMADAMNRSVANVFFGGFGAAGGALAAATNGGQTARATSAADVAIQLSYARLVVVVPGYGMAVAQAQRAVADLAAALEKRGVEVLYAIHPVAGRMPGHMNVLLAEADVPYEQLKEMDDINPEFARTDVALVIGANDVTNPAARNEPGSPIYGMPILDVDKASSVIVLKRSMASGFAGIDNPLFYDAKTAMLFGDAKSSVGEVLAEIQEL
ncbi:MAG: NAD(P)(+) transhydrogenase (Re/Si-specific) subunit beta [Microvirga sp.]